MSRVFAAASGRRSKLVVFLVWLVAIFVSAGPLGLPEKFADAEKNESTSFLPGDAESTKALEATKRLQGGEFAAAVIVYRRASGLTAADRRRIAEDRAALNRLRAEGLALARSGAEPRDERLLQLGHTTPFGRPIPSRDGRSALVINQVKGTGEAQGILDPVELYRERASDPGGGLQVKVTGGAGYGADAIKIFDSLNGTLLLAAGSLVVFLLILIYRSPLFFWIPLAAVGFAEVASRAIGYGLTELGVTVNGQASSIMSVLVLGAGTDYALLLVARYREELHHHDDKHEALMRAMRSAGPAIFASAITVIAALLCLSVAEVNGTAGLGPIGAIGVAVAMVAMLTVLPAMLAIFGRRAFWPFVPHAAATRPDPSQVTAFGHRRIVEASMLASFAWGALAVAAATLLSPVLLVEQVLRRLSGRRLPAPLFAALDRNVFRAHELRRVQREHLADETHGAWRRVGERVAVRPRRVWIGVAALLGVFALGSLNFSTGLTTGNSYRGDVEAVEGQELLSKSFPSGANAPTEVVVRDPGRVRAVEGALRRVDGVAGVRLADRGSAGTLLQATLEPPPYSTEAYDLVAPIRVAAKRAGGPGTLVGGPTAVEVDLRDASARDTRLIVPMALLVVFLVLVLLLRALIGPAILIGTVILSFAASLGVSSIVYDVVFGFPGSDPSLPLFAFVFLVALGIDYNIFLMARVREETQRFGTRHGMLRGLAVTGGVITSAGIVLAGTFSVLAVLPLVYLTEIGFVIAFGVLLDTFVVRSLLVPALTFDLRARIWWPSRLAHEDEFPERDDTAAEAAPAAGLQPAPERV